MSDSAQQTKTCTHCQQVFTRPPRQNNLRWHARVFCGSECQRAAAKASRKERQAVAVPGRVCVECQADLIKRPSQAPSAYQAQLYCSTSCCHAFRRRVRYRKSHPPHVLAALAVNGNTPSDDAATRVWML